MKNNETLKNSYLIYGREKEKEILTDAFHRISKGEFKYISIKGNSGTGKTQLITRTLKPIIRDGFFIYGKFEQFNFGEPYIAFVQAFKNLINQILTEPKEEVKKWNKKLKAVLGRNGAVIARLIPEIESIIGKQHFIDEIDPQKTKRKFETVFKKFIQVFAVEDHPLVLFIDDLQWADAASLQLLRYLCENQNSSLLIIGAYRNEEIKEINLLIDALKEIEGSSSRVEDILLNNLSLNDTINMISDSLKGEINNVSELGETVYRKTLGNPLFINQMLNLFYDEKYLYFNEQKNKWNCNNEYINSVKIPNSIVELVINNLKKLSNETLECLKIAACIGTTFDLKTISMVIESTPQDTLNKLMKAVSEGLILPQAEHKKLLKRNEDISQIDIDTRFEFFHDRVQQGVCILISPIERKEKYIRIGRILLRNTTADDLDKKILNIMVSLNHGLDLITDNHERIKLSEYNLMAGKKAKASTAWEASLKYLKAGIILLPDDAWENYYQLTYELYIEFSQSQYLTNHYEEAEKLFEIILNKAKTKQELAETYYLKTVLYSSSGDYENAITTGIQGLKYLGINFPENPSKLDLLKEIIVSKWYFRNSNIKKLNITQNNSPRIKKAQEILTSFGGPVNAINKELYPLLIMKMANLSGKYGAAEYSTFGYVVYSFVAGTYLGNYKKGHEIQKAALELVEKYPDSNYSYLTYFFTGAMVNHWTCHGEKSLIYLEKAYNKSMEAGDYIFMSYAFVVVLEYKMVLGKNLSSTYQYIIDHSEMIKKMPNISLFAEISKQMMEILEGKKDIKSLVEKFNVKDNGSENMAYFLYSIELLYLCGDYENALLKAQEAKAYEDAIKGYISSAEYIFYYALSITAAFEQLCEKEKKANWKELNKNLKMLEKWADNCPENFLHKYALVSAEIARIEGNIEKARRDYLEAIHSSYENGYIQNHAIANELTAKFYISIGKEETANIYLNEAYESYIKWGAKAKATQLKEHYKGIVLGEETKSYHVLQSPKINTENIQNNKFDLLIDRLQNISKEGDQDKQLREFLEIAICATNAEKGAVLIEENDELNIYALKENKEYRVTYLDEIILEESNMLPKKVIRYITRTYETTLITENIPMSIFASDDYLIEKNPFSIACVPLKSQGIFTGVLYLENMDTRKNEIEKILQTMEVFSNNIAYERKHKIKQPVQDTDTSTIQSLSKREQEVLELIGKGLSNKEIATSLDLTINTVKTHTKNLYTKLGVYTRVQAVTRAKELRMHVNKKIKAKT